MGEDGVYCFKDEYTWQEACDNIENELVTVFKDGKLVNEQNLQEVRARLHGGEV